jgi:hypothetical protein
MTNANSIFHLIDRLDCRSIIIPAQDFTEILSPGKLSGTFTKNAGGAEA